MPYSMTGFARSEQNMPWGTVTCELRSVNHRYLEPTLRLPDTIRAIENTLRSALKRKLARGKIDASIHIKYDQDTQHEMSLNLPLVKNIQMLTGQIEDSLDRSAAINPMDILNWPGVLNDTEIDQQTLASAAEQAFEEALNALLAHREREGQELLHFLHARLDSVSKHVTRLRVLLPEILSTHQNKLREKVDNLKVDLDEDRLAQELVYLAQKSDVAEELDRLDAHIIEVKRALKQNQAIGRRLDFLMQELNREANTLSSKSISSETTQIAVDLKVLIEQMREQVQNIE